jgi:hypothetical protein
VYAEVEVIAEDTPLPVGTAQAHAGHDL